MGWFDVCWDFVVVVGGMRYRLQTFAGAVEAERVNVVDRLHAIPRVWTICTVYLEMGGYLRMSTQTGRVSTVRAAVLCFIIVVFDHF